MENDNQAEQVRFTFNDIHRYLHDGRYPEGDEDCGDVLGDGDRDGVQGGGGDRDGVLKTDGDCEDVLEGDGDRDGVLEGEGGGV